MAWRKGVKGASGYRALDQGQELHKLKDRISSNTVVSLISKSCVSYVCYRL